MSIKRDLDRLKSLAALLIAHAKTRDGVVPLLSSDGETILRTVTFVEQAVCAGPTFNPVVTATTPDLVRKLSGRPLVEVVYQLASAVGAPWAFEVPKDLEQVPPLVAKLHGKPGPEAARRLAIEVNILESKLAALLAATERELGESSAGFGRVLRNATEATGRKRKPGERPRDAEKKSPNGSVAEAFKVAADSFGDVVAVFGWVARGIGTYRFVAGKEVPRNPMPINLPTSLEEVFAELRRRLDHHAKIVRLHSVAIADGNEDQVEQLRYHEGVAHALVHVLDLLVALGTNGFELRER